jgi:hypothetical protein
LSQWSYNFTAKLNADYHFSVKTGTKWGGTRFMFNCSGHHVTNWIDRNTPNEMMQRITMKNGLT